LIEALALRGYPVAREVSRRLIGEGMLAGRSVLQVVSDPAYPFAVTREQLRLEASLRLDQARFFDKAAPSQWPYHVLAGHDADSLFEECRDLYAQVFVLDRLPLHHDGLRLEDEQTCAQLDRLQEHAYRRLGYEVVRVPKLSVDDRVAFVLGRQPKSNPP
jgi:predicted ATPase